MDSREEMKELQQTLKEIDAERDKINKQIQSLQQKLNDANMNREQILNRMNIIEQQNSLISSNNHNNNHNNKPSLDNDPKLIEYRQPHQWDSEVTESLHKIFKLSTFRPLQRSIINCTLSEHDCFVVMPSGGGKSLCYQLPATIKAPHTYEGVTVVISPLISLMVDQVYQLNKIGISLVIDF